MALTHKHEQVRRIALRSARRVARMSERREKLVESLLENMPKKDRQKAEVMYMLGICQGYRIAKGWVEKRDYLLAKPHPAVKPYLKFSRKFVGI